MIIWGENQVWYTICIISNGSCSR